MRTSRREFLRTSLGATAALAMGRRGAAQTPPSDRLQVAVVGTRGWGSAHVNIWSSLPDVELAALCDVDERVAAEHLPALEEKTGKRPKVYRDIRELLEDESIDAVSIATPNHWHSLAAIWAVQAGKDVYVEKPVSHNPWEGRRLVEAARKHGRVVQVGTQLRSLRGLREGMAWLRSGELGAVRHATGIIYKKREPIAPTPDTPPPDHVDFDLWLGPAPERPFNRSRFHYLWHWCWDYGCGEIGNIGVHYLDQARWGLGKQEHPVAVQSLGARLGPDDAGETPNTQLALYDWGDAQLVFEVRGLPSKPWNGIPMGVLFQCEGGTVKTGISWLEAWDTKGRFIRRFTGGRDEDHFKNFVVAAKARNPELLHAEVLEGHLSATLTHLANASYRLGARQVVRTEEGPFGEYEAASAAFGRLREHLRENGLDPDRTLLQVGKPLAFDGESETVPGNARANALLRRTNRAPFVVPSS